MTTTETTLNGQPQTGAVPSTREEPAPGKTSGNADTAPVDPVATVRAKQDRKWRKKVAKAEAKATGRQALAQTQLDIADSRDTVDQRAALRKRRKMTDGGSHLASMYRRYRLIVTGLLLGALAAMTWASYNVAHGLSPEPAPLYYAVEGIFSLPLICIVFMQVTAAESGRLAKLKPVTRNARGHYRPTITGVIEFGLLSLTVLIATWPSLSAPEFHFERFITSGFAPVMVVVFVTLQLVAADLFGEIIREAWMNGDDSDGNLRERVKRANQLMHQVKTAMSDQDNPMPVQADDGLPSVSAIQKRFPSEKLTAQAAHDALALFRQEGGKS